MWEPRRLTTLWTFMACYRDSFTFILDGGEWSASCSCHSTPGEETPGAHWIGGWVGPRVGLDTVEKRQISCPRRKMNPNSSATQPVTIPSELSLLYCKAIYENSSNYFKYYVSVICSKCKQREQYFYNFFVLLQICVYTTEKLDYIN
jgi:hypothetical protein